MDKDRFDALHKLAEQAWRDWDHKTRYQWRLAFAIWGAILAAISLIVTQHIHVPSWIPILICSLLFLIHWFFLGWIEGRIRDCRRQMFQYVSEMEAVLNISSDEIAKFSSNVKKEKPVALDNNSSEETQNSESKKKRPWWRCVFRFKEGWP